MNMLSDKLANISKPSKSTIVVIAGTTLLGGVVYRYGIFSTAKSYIQSGLQTFYENQQMRAKTLAISWFSSAIKEDKRFLFRSLAKTATTLPIKHSHPIAAADRNSVRAMLNQYSVLSGQPMHYISMSTGEAEDKIGDKYYYFPKDMLTKPRFDKIPNNGTVAFVDVDYYVDMPNFLGQRDCLIYTTDPLSLGGKTANGAFSFTNDQYTLMVNGGAKYSHGLWDYDSDIIFQKKWYGGNLYTVEIQRLNDHRSLVFINYRRTLYTPLAWLAFPNQSLSRKRVSDGLGFNHQKQLTLEGEIIHHFSREGCFFDVTMNDKDLNNLLVRTGYSKNPQLSDVERLFRSSNTSDALSSASLMYDYIMKSRKLSKTVVSMGFEDCYQALKPLVTEDGKPMTRRLLDPILDVGVAPVKSLNNDTACIEGRVNRVKNQVDSYPSFYYTVMAEYLEHLIPEPNILAPWGFDQQSAKFCNKTQQKLIEKAENYMYYDSPFAVQSFQKAETYGKITDPRNISTLPMGHNFRLGQFSYVLSQFVFKEQAWYAFGKHPKFIAERVVKVASKCSRIVPSDISKYDGSRGRIYHDLDMATARRAFKTEYVEEIAQLINKERKVRGYTALGCDYEAEFNTLSGSSKTTWGNTNGNAFTVYLSLRLSGQSEQEAWDNLGVYGGDDGLTGDIDENQLNATFAKLGILAKSETILNSQPVPFLGRVYVNPWVNGHSFIDVTRQLPKLHITTAPKTVEDYVCLSRKALGYLTTDGNTPLITQWSQSIETILGTVYISEADFQLTKKDVNYWSKFEYPFEPITDSERQVALSWISTQLDVSITDLCNLEDHFKTSTTTTQLHSIALPSKLKVEIDVVYRGVINSGNRPDHQALINVQKNSNDKQVAPTDGMKAKGPTPSVSKPISKSKKKNDKMKEKKKALALAKVSETPLKQSVLIDEDTTPVVETSPPVTEVPFKTAGKSKPKGKDVKKSKDSSKPTTNEIPVGKPHKKPGKPKGKPAKTPPGKDNTNVVPKA